MSTIAYLGLGANLGDPIQQIVDARQQLQELTSSQALRCSNLYVSSPVGYDDQPDFVNCVIELKTLSGAEELLDQMQIIEQTLGRQRIEGNQNGPRTIDIDMLLFGNSNIKTPRLIVPHPRIKERLFVLKPLLELLDSDYYRTALNQGNFTDQVLTRLAIGG